MNIIQARQLIARDVPKPSYNEMKRCVRLLFRSPDLCHQERIALLEALQSKISSAFENDSLVEKIKSVIARVYDEKARLDERIEILTQECRDSLIAVHDELVEYAVLDSLPEIPESNRGFTEVRALQFFLSQLTLFHCRSPSAEVSQLIRALEALFELHIVIGGRCFKIKIVEKLKQLSEGEIPYFFLPISSKVHAMIGKMGWIEGEGYQFTIINSGRRRGAENVSRISDLVYRGLSQKDVISIARVLSITSESTNDLYIAIEKALPASKRTPSKGRVHSFQKKDSCAIKCLTSAMHTVLSNAVLRRFKVFYTQQLMWDMNPGIKYDAANEVLKKRQRKLVCDV